MIENSMFEEEPDVVDLAKDSSAFPVQFSSLIPIYTTTTYYILYILGHHLKDQLVFTSFVQGIVSYSIQLISHAIR